MKQITKKQDGFTLIEVVLVLAIGALIILMALLAFTGAQRARRDTARTNLVGTMRSAVEQYAANSSGKYPTTISDLKTNNGWKDPLKGSAGIVNWAADLGSTGIAYKSPGVCNGTSVSAGSGDSYAIQYKQENGQLVCTDNTK